MDWLTREQIDEVLDTLSADDVIEALTGEEHNVKKGTNAFLRAAERQGIEEPLKKVKAADLSYLAKRIGEVVNVDSPLSDGTGA